MIKQMLVNDSGKVYFLCACVCICLKVAFFSSRGKYLLLCVSLKYNDIFE